MAAIDINTSYISSSSSDCASERIAPYADRPDTPITSVHSHFKPLHHEKPCFLDQHTRSRLLQLYTTRTPVSSAKQIQSHFTCHYLTRSNIDDVLHSRTQTINQHKYSTSPFSNLSSRLDDLTKLLHQSWRVSFGTLDFLELVWTGRRPSRNWADLVTACTCDQQPDFGNDRPCPLGVDEDEFLALNLTVTYFYTADGQPTMSLVAVAMTRDAYDTILAYIDAQTSLSSSLYNQTTPTNSNFNFNFNFDRTPFVHRDLLVPTLCRWRNASVSTILNRAAESRAWTSKVLSETHMYIDPTHDEMEVDTSPYTATESEDQNQLFSICTNPTSTRTHEPRACLLPGRDAVFRSIVSNISVTLNQKWTRRSSQFDSARDNTWSRRSDTTTEIWV